MSSQLLGVLCLTQAGESFDFAGVSKKDFLGEGILVLGFLLILTKADAERLFTKHQ